MISYRPKIQLQCAFTGLVFRCLPIFIVLFSSCAKEFINPYDPATPPDIWMPESFRLDTLGTNALRLSWNQEEQHIDGFAIQKTTNGQIKEILLPLDSLRYTDIQAVDTSSDEVCPELSYKVMARAGNNRSLDIGTASGIRMPLSTPANAGNDILVADTATTVQLNAQAATAGEAGRWSIVSGTGGTFANDRQHNTSFTGTPCNAYVLRWTKQGCTETFDELSVSFYPSLTVASAGSDQVFTNSTTQTTLNANAPGLAQTGLWTIVSGEGGTFTDATAPNTTFSGTSCTEYVLKWTISGSCGNSEDNVLVRFMKATTAANAGADQSFTSNVLSTTLTANAPSSDETGTWSIISGTGGTFSDINTPNTQFSGTPCTNYTLQWAIQGTCSLLTDLVNVSFQQVTVTANAGPDQLITSSSTSVTLAANNPVAGETGTWSIVSGNGGSFSNVNAPNATFNGNACTNYILQWSIQGTCSNSSDQVSINFQQTPNTANAGSDQTASTLTVSLAANAPTNGVTGTWSIVSGTGGSFSNVTSPNSLFTGVWGQTYSLKWTLLVYTCNTLSFDEVIITFPSATPHTCGATNVHNPVLSYGSMSDQQGNVYKTIVIGSQEWMAENLKTTIYRNGDEISNVTDGAQWIGLTAGAWCSYNNDSQYDCPYGKLYNWYAVADSRNVCPTGWHVPSDGEWTILTNALGGVAVAGGKMKSTGTQNWLSTNTSATNESGFSGLPGGYRSSGGTFGNIGDSGNWWSSTENLTYFAWSRGLGYSNGSVLRNYYNKKDGFSVRCLRD